MSKVKPTAVSSEAVSSEAVSSESKPTKVNLVGIYELMIWKKITASTQKKVAYNEATFPDQYQIARTRVMEKLDAQVKRIEKEQFRV